MDREVIDKVIRDLDVAEAEIVSLREQLTQLCKRLEEREKVIKAALEMYSDGAFHHDNLDRWATWAAIELNTHGPLEGE